MMLPCANDDPLVCPRCGNGRLMPLAFHSYDVRRCSSCHYVFDAAEAPRRSEYVRTPHAASNETGGPTG